MPQQDPARRDGSVALPTEVRLRDGTPALVWPLLPEDREGLRVAYDALSPESKHRRFLSDVQTLSDGLLRLLVDAVDGVDHIALVLVAFPPDGPEQLVGVGRLIRHREQPDSADVAVTVLDAWQGRGVASVLLSELVRRRGAGVGRLATQVATGNPGSLAMLRRLGDFRVTGVDCGVYDVEVDLLRAG
ncbi:MAG: GNAT family N-acetyltransferase [Actinomycetota bacterium]|nr:GNAT family N-acetyltransferase [Actinomycetota bacterium]